MKYFHMKFNIHLQHGHELALLNIINHAALYVSCEPDSKGNNGM